MMKKYKVYLSGPIEEVSHDVASNWRLALELELPHDVFECLNPMDWAHSQDTPENYYDNDVERLSQADVLAVDLRGAPKKALLRGTTWEVGFATAKRLPIYIVFRDETQVKEFSPWLTMAAWDYILESELKGKENAITRLAKELDWDASTRMWEQGELGE